MGRKKKEVTEVVGVVSEVITITPEESKILERMKFQGTMSQEEAKEYHRLLNIVGE